MLGRRDLGIACRRRLEGAVLLVTLAAACGPPPRLPTPPAETLYARRPQLAGLDTSALRGHRILIDPGHGGRFGGAEGVERTREADVNLGVALYLWGLLHDAGADVQLTRASDRDLLADSTQALRDDLAARVALLDSLGPEVFLSLHHNSNAALDRERNDIETYFKLDDEGPSYDLARAIHAQLARHLGIAEARLLPGNYFVLRNAGTPAVLGEASYLSNPRVESRLRLADKQRLEAEAYFLGLLDYFRRGATALVKLEPAGDTLQAGGTLRFRLQDRTRGGLDPLTAELRVDGAPVDAHLEVEIDEIVLPAAALAPGAHDVLVRARSLRGNAARAWHGRIVVHAPAARLGLAQEPDPAAPGSEVRLRVRVLDVLGRSVGDGCPVSAALGGGQILEIEPATRGGEVLGRARLPAGEPRLQLQAEGVREEFALHVRDGGAAVRFARCVDARDGTPLADAWVRCGDRLAGSDRAGYVRLDAGRDTLRVERRAYVPWRGLPPADGLLQLEPLHRGRLHGVRIVLDPAGDGAEPSSPNAGVSNAHLSYDVCRFLGQMLEAAGARVVLTRGIVAAVPDVERVRVAAGAGAEWYLRVDTASAPGPAVLYYPGSGGGERLAKGIAPWIARRLGRKASLGTDTRLVLQQTPCPAVLVLVPVAAPAAGAHVDEPVLRLVAYALFVGIRSALDPEVVSLPPLAGSVQPPGATGLVFLDAAEALPLARDGSFCFEAVAAGRRLLALHSPGAEPSEVEVTVGGGDTTHVVLPAPRARP